MTSSPEASDEFRAAGLEIAMLDEEFVRFEGRGSRCSVVPLCVQCADRPWRTSGPAPIMVCERSLYKGHL